MAPQKVKGFTLVEMLCVLAIIASLAAIIYPAFAGVTRAAKKVTCLSNLAQIGKAEYMYRIDNDDHYPYAVTEFDRADPYRIPGGTNMTKAQIAAIPDIVSVLTPYTGSRLVFQCPMDSGLKDLVANTSTQNAFLTYGTSYEVFPIFTNPPFDRTTGEDISESPRLIIAEDFSLAWHSGGDISYLTARHNLLLGDSHVQSALMSEGGFVIP